MPRQTEATADGRTFAVRFEGFSRPLVVTAPQGGAVQLLPWTYAAHMAALRDSAVTLTDGLALDRWGFACHVLRHSGLTVAGQDWLLPVALWWAGGGGETPANAGANTTQFDFLSYSLVDLGSTQARLRPWTEGERLAALGAMMARDGSANDWFDGVGYLDAMVRRSLVALEPPVLLDDLDSLATNRLLTAVTALNIHEPESDPLLSGLLPEAVVEATLELCRALGWTPAQVLGAPAAEVQRLMALQRQATPSTPIGTSGFGTHPDATVFTFAEDVQ